MYWESLLRALGLVTGKITNWTQSQSQTQTQSQAIAIAIAAGGQHVSRGWDRDRGQSPLMAIGLLETLQSFGQTLCRQRLGLDGTLEHATAHEIVERVHILKELTYFAAGLGQLGGLDQLLAAPAVVTDGR